MITDMSVLQGEEQETRDALQFLADSSFEFIPTGSRAFGMSRPDSDYDFFTDVTVGDFLRRSGFRKISGEYEDSHTVSVYRRGKVDVQLVRNIASKKVVQKMLLNFPDSIKLLSVMRHKSDSRLLWDFMFHAEEYFCSQEKNDETYSN